MMCPRGGAEEATPKKNIDYRASRPLSFPRMLITSIRPEIWRRVVFLTGATNDLSFEGVKPPSGSG
eukprot:7389200-Prymnesium_polylepis.1